MQISVFKMVLIWMDLTRNEMGTTRTFHRYQFQCCRPAPSCVNLQFVSSFLPNGVSPTYSIYQKRKIWSAWLLSFRRCFVFHSNPLRSAAIAGWNLYCRDLWVHFYPIYASRMSEQIALPNTKKETTADRLQKRSGRLSVCLNVCLSVCLSVWLSVCLSVIFI